MQKTNIIVIFLILLIVNNNAFSQDWNLKYDKEGIKVYTKETKQSEMDEFRGMAVIDAPIEVITELLRDVSAYNTWVYNCSKAEILQKKNKNDFIIFYVNDSPWPVDDRWVVLQSESTVDCQNLKVIIKMYNTEYAKKLSTDGMVKMTKMTGDYTLEYLAQNKTRVTYTMFADPGGSVPANLANMASVDIPFETLKEMKKMVKKDKYIKGSRTSGDKALIEDCLTKKKNKLN